MPSPTRGESTSNSASLVAAKPSSPWRGEVRDAAVRRRPLRRLGEEIAHFLQRLGVEVFALFRNLKRVPPCRQVMQLDAEVFQMAGALGEDVVIKHHEAVLDLRAGGAQRVAEIDLAAAVRGQILDEQRAGAGCEFALDLRIAAEALRLL